MRRSHPCATQAANDRAEQLRRNTYWAPALASTFLTPRYKGDLAATYAETAAVRDALHALTPPDGELSALQLARSTAAPLSAPACARSLRLVERAQALLQEVQRAGTFQPWLPLCDALGRTTLLGLTVVVVLRFGFPGVSGELVFVVVDIVEGRLLEAAAVEEGA